MHPIQIVFYLGLIFFVLAFLSVRGGVSWIAGGLLCWYLLSHWKW